MELPSIEDLVAGLDQKRQSDVDQAQDRLLMPFGIEKRVTRLIESYPRVKSWRGRNVILFELIRFARAWPEVLVLALDGLNDPAYLVRMQSCVMLAYSQREDMIPHLKEILAHKDAKTREYARQAMAHIENKTVFYDFNVIESLD